MQLCPQDHVLELRVRSPQYVSTNLVFRTLLCSFGTGETVPLQPASASSLILFQILAVDPLACHRLFDIPPFINLDSAMLTIFFCPGSTSPPILIPVHLVTNLLCYITYLPGTPAPGRLLAFRSLFSIKIRLGRGTQAITYQLDEYQSCEQIAAYCYILSHASTTNQNFPYHLYRLQKILVGISRLRPGG